MSLTFSQSSIRNAALLKRSRRALFLLFVVIITLSVIQTPILRRLRDNAWYTWININAKIFNVGPLRVEDGVLDQLQKLQRENIRLKAEHDEYLILKEQLGSLSFDNLKKIPVMISVNPADIFKTRLIVNQGVRDGVTMGAPVVIQDSTMIGTVVELNDHTSIIQLLIHPDTNLAAEVTEEDNARGLLKGQTFTSIVFSTIPRDASITQGQRVVTVEENNIPSGLFLGTIRDVRNEKNEAYQQATLKLPYDPSKLRAANILVSP